MSTIGDKIKSLREARTLTQAQLAEQSGVDYNTLRKIETWSTLQPSYWILLKIAETFWVSVSYFSDDRPKVKWRNSLPFTELSWEDFEKMVLQILLNHSGYSNPEWQWGTSDKGRDIIAQNKEISWWKSLFQCKRYQRHTIKIFMDALNSIFGNKENYPYEIKEIIFCTAIPVSANMKDSTKTHAKNLWLPEPIFWDSQTLDLLIKDRAPIMNEFFGWHIQEAIKSIQEWRNENRQDHEEIMTTLQQGTIIPAGKAIVDIASAKSDMRKAKELISEWKHKQALEILLGIERIIQTDDLKKIKNNIGVCYLQQYTHESAMQSIELFRQALYIDQNFFPAKQNLIGALMNSWDAENKKEALKLATELYEEDKGNHELLTLLMHSLRLNHENVRLTNFIEQNLGELEKIVAENEFLAISFTEATIEVDKYIELESLFPAIIEAFPNSVVLLTYYWKVILRKLDREHYFKRNDHDVTPIVDTDEWLTLLRKAHEFFMRANILVGDSDTDHFMKYDILTGIRDCEYIIAKSRWEYLWEKQFQYYESELKAIWWVASELVKHFGQLLEQRNLPSAYEKFIEIYDSGDSGMSANELLNIAYKFFWRWGSEYAIRVLKFIPKDLSDMELKLESNALLSIAYTLEGDKESAILYTNILAKLANTPEANDAFKKKVFSHNAAIMMRFPEESERFVKNAFTLQEVSPEWTVMKMIKWIEEDETGARLSDEMLEMLSNNQKHYNDGIDAYKNNPYPIYFLQKWFNKSLPEVIDMIAIDSKCYIIYDESSSEEQDIKKIMESDELILDYLSLYNLSNTGQLGLLSHVWKTIWIHEGLFMEVQQDLIANENIVVRRIWQFLKTSKSVKLIPAHSEYAKISWITDEFGEWLRELFADWIVQSISFAQKRKIPIVTDDLRLGKFISWNEIHESSINTLKFFQAWFIEWYIDKIQYGHILAKLSEVHNIFLPFDSEDLYNIFQEDERVFLGNNRIPHISFKDFLGEFRVSLRFYHIINQINLPWSNIESFLVVIAEFWKRVNQAWFTHETKINLTLFLSNFLSSFIEDDWIKKSQGSVENVAEFIMKSWIILFSTMQEKDDIKVAIDKIRHQELRNTIKEILAGNGSGN